MRQYEGNDFRESRLKREMVSIRVVSDRGFNCTLKKQTAMRITAIECNIDCDNFGWLIFFFNRYYYQQNYDIGLYNRCS